ncbi:glycosyltransferase family 9 protein [Thiothrix caldifontis]|uniref:glycosyltransferase family 9 protein n=1 Tax=Thiothrix caldifontis TaxID=525918 RepID=UPI000A9B19DC|nr:glycosyltransferase family 9 protein [Thiothrix caldifontis]
MAKRILIIIRRSNGDVLLASPLIQHLQAHYPGAAIDLLINDDTLGIAQALPHVRQIHTYSYGWKKLPLWQRLRTEMTFIRRLFRQYDLAISLTATDSSVLYALLFGRHSISVIDTDRRKNWWKKRVLTGYYQVNNQRHVIANNLQVLPLLGISTQTIECAVQYSPQSERMIRERLMAAGIASFMIFHPSAQYAYKVYPEALRQALLQQLSRLGMQTGVAIVVTGAKTPLDLQIKAALLKSANVYDWIGETSLDEYIALSDLSMAYIGGDTLNMHIAAAQNKRVFAIFGPTLLPVWSPWSNTLQSAATLSQPEQTYDNITVFQAAMSCVPCGQAGCDNRHGKSECLYRIEPASIANAVGIWLHEYRNT